MKPLKAVFFDLDDTLCDDAGAWVRSADAAARLVKGRTDIDQDKLVGAFLVRSEAYWMSLEPVTETRSLLEIRSSQWAGALEDVAGIADPALAIELGREYGERRSKDIRLFPDAIETLDLLIECGLKCALITNGVKLTHVEKIQFLGLESKFDHILIADVIGHFKPHRGIFDAACRLCHCEPGEAVMVGDHLRNDVGGAQSIGITAYWFNPSGLDRDPADPVPAGQITSLSDLIELIEPRLP